MSDHCSSSSRLGVAGGMAKAFVHSPLSLLFFIAMLALGILGLKMTPRQEDPQISVPMVDVLLQFPGASSQQVANLAIEPMERMLSEIPGVKHVYSVSQRERGMATVQFKVGEQMGPSLVKVHDKLQANRDQMPPGVLPPSVKAVGIDDVPVVTISLWSNEAGDADLRRLALEILQDVSRDADVGRGFVVGGRSQQVQVEVSPEDLSGYGVSLGQIEQTVRGANSQRSTGHVEAENRQYSVSAGRFLRGAEDVANLNIQTGNGGQLNLSQVATVKDAPEDFRHVVNYFSGAAYGRGEAQQQGLVADGAAAVTVAFAKKIGTNGVDVAKRIIQRVEDLKGRIIPEQVHVEVTRNYGATANQKVNELIFKLFVATGAVTLLVFLSLGLRPAFIVTLVIPVVLLMTVFAAWVGGFTIDRVSLFALIFSIGILVDDAIVVIENIYRRWLMNGKIDTATAVDAVREVGNPTIIATLTVVAALLPMGMVRGMMGPYMSPIPALGSVAMLISLFAAFVFVPWLALRFRPSMQFLQKAQKREHASEAKLDRLFRRVLGPLLDSRKKGWAFLLGLVGVFFLVMLMFPSHMVRVKMLPFDNKPEFAVVVDMPEGTAVGVTTNVAWQIAERLRQEPEVTAIQTYAGTAKPFDFNGMVRHYYLRQSPWQGEVQLQLLDKHERAASSHDVAVRARALLQQMQAQAAVDDPMAKASLSVVEMPPGPPVLQTVVAEVYGPDRETRQAFAKDMAAMFRQSRSLDDVDTYIPEAYQYWRFEVDLAKTTKLGLTVDSIIRQVDQAMGDYRLGDIKAEGLLEPTWIVLQVPLAVRADVQRLSDLPIADAHGATVPLSQLGEFVRLDEDPVIYHKDLRPVEYVVADAVGKLGAPVYPMLEIGERLASYTAPDGVKVSGEWLGPPEDRGTSAFEWTGEWTVTFETFRDMGLAFAAALVLIYILVVAEFGNFVVPAIIMAPIPLTLLGILPGHWLMNAEFTATSMIGFIALAGIIVRNSILLVDFAIDAIAQGESVREAVLQACKARTRPIMITAFALVLGSMVILSDPIFQGMAVSLLFGVLVSTVLTLVVIPLGCISAGKYLVRSH